MKALSIMQPWAWLIVNGFKAVENRSWNTNFRGPLLIHAGKKFDEYAFEFISDTFPDVWNKMPDRQLIERGGIVGSCTLDHVVEERHKHLLTSRDKPWFFGEFGFILENASPLKFMPLRGQLGFFEVEYAI